MVERYPAFIESVIEFRVYHRKVLAERKGETYEINPEHETCPLAKGYRIIKEADYQYRCEKVPEEEEPVEVEQLDKESEPVHHEAEQANEQEYLKSQNQEEIKESPSNQVSNNQLSEPDPSIPKSPPNQPREEEKPLQQKEKSPGPDDSVNIKLDLASDSAKKNDEAVKAPAVVETQPKQMTNNVETNIIVSSNPNNHNEVVKWTKSSNERSQPALMIEAEEADKAGGMCSCSK